MTRKEKVLASMLKLASRDLQEKEDKDILKLIHTTNPNFENLSIFSWLDKYGEKNTNKKIKLNFSKK